MQEARRLLRATSPLRAFDSESDMPDCVPKGARMQQAKRESLDSFQSCKPHRHGLDAHGLVPVTSGPQEKGATLFYLPLAVPTQRQEHYYRPDMAGGNLGSIRIIGAEQQLRYACRKIKLQTSCPLRIVT